MCCHNVGGALVCLHDVEPHAVPLEFGLLNEQTRPNVNTYWWGGHPDHLQVKSGIATHTGTGMQNK